MQSLALDLLIHTILESPMHTRELKVDYLVKHFCKMVLSGAMLMPEFIRTISEVEESSDQDIDEMFLDWTS